MELRRKIQSQSRFSSLSRPKDKRKTNRKLLEEKGWDNLALPIPNPQRTNITLYKPHYIHVCTMYPTQCVCVSFSPLPKCILLPPLATLTSRNTFRDKLTFSFLRVGGDTKKRKDELMGCILAAPSLKAPYTIAIASPSSSSDFGAGTKDDDLIVHIHTSCHGHIYI